ncbi:MAG: hypothetical protein GY927_02410 [bacterium]|nr:hypothetical protein [bacterium]
MPPAMPVFTPNNHNGAPPSSFAPQSFVPASPPPPVQREVAAPEPTPVLHPSPTSVDFVPATAIAEMPVVSSNGHANGKVPAPTVTPPTPVFKDKDFPTVLIQVTADKTGYPEDMLDLESDLEADLGIDSIKRVEILSEMQQRFPQLAEVEAERLSTLQSLREILELYRQQSGPGEVAADEAPFVQTS